MSKENNENLNLRIEKLIEEAIATFKLDLTGLTVLTEAATGNFRFGPVIAAKAGARKVFAYGRTSKYGSAVKVRNLLKKTCEDYRVLNQVKVIPRLSREIISQADIVTNSGALRPIDRSFIQTMKPKAVIPLMYESWEFRASDLDLAAAQECEIMIMGTDESACGIFEYVGPLAIKMILEAGLELKRDNFLIISSDHFGREIKQALEPFSTKVKVIGLSPFQLKDLGWPRLDGVIAADIRAGEALIGSKGSISAQDLKKYYPEAKVIQFAGQVEVEALENNFIEYYPNYPVGAFRMGQTFGDLGPKAVIEYLAAGLKVGEVMARARRKHSDIKNSTQEALKSSICQVLK